MKTLGQISEIVNKDVNVKYPFGANIQNETDILFGTPVVREIYGDILMNLYRLLELTKENPTNTEDNKNTQFQLVNSIKKLANDINDSVEVMQLDGTQFSLNVDFSILPNNFVKIVKPAENYNFSNDYTVIGLDENEYEFVSTTGFNASDIVLLIFETIGTCTAYSLTKSIDNTSVFTPFGKPIKVNTSQNMMYNKNGILLKSDLTSIDLQTLVRTVESDATLIVENIFYDNGKIVFTATTLSNNSFYKVYFMNDNSSIIDTVFDVVSALNIPTNVNKPICFFENGFLYLSNASGSSTNKYIIDKYELNYNDDEMVFSSRININSSYRADKNAIMKGACIFEYNGILLDKYELSTGDKTTIANFVNLEAELFMFDNKAYFTTGEVGTKLNI